MKNLSKTLSLVLAFALAFTMFAGVSAIEFSDVADVENVDAIKTMATIGVIKGYTDGTFQPDKTVTRAEMAKMIYVFKMGGEDDGAAYYTGVASKLSDISGHWAEGYIKYCENLGIIAGRGDGKFYPDDTVTGLEAAKMLLIVQGYDAEKAGLVGMGWATKTASLGADSEFFKNYGPQLAAECPREYAALMMYNALDATYMTWDNDSGSYVKSTKTEDTKTLGQKYMNLATVEGVLVGVGDETNVGTIIATGVTAPTAGKDKISIDVERVNDSIATAPAAATAATIYTKDTHTFECSDETVANLYGQYVRASVNTKKDTILGIFAVDSKNNVVESTVSKVQLITGETEKIKVDGTSYKIETGALVYDFGTYGAATTVTTGTAWTGYFAGSTSDAAANGSAVKFIDNDGDGKFELAIVSDITAFAEVSSVSSTKFSANGTYNFDDVIVNGDIKEGAYVARTYNPFVSKYVFTVVEPVEGEATALKKVHFNNDSIRIDGTWYSLADNAAHNAVNANLVDFSGTFAAGNSYKVYAVGNVIYVADKVAAGTTGDLALVIDTGANVTGNVYNTKIMLPDGTKKTLKMDMKSYTDNSGTAAKLSGSPVGQAEIGALISYNVSDDDADVYDLYYIGHYDKDGNVIDAGYDVYTSAQIVTNSQSDKTTAPVTNGLFAEKNAKLGTTPAGNGTQSIADDAIVFIGYNDDTPEAAPVALNKMTFKVITGKALKAFSKDFGYDGAHNGSYAFLSDGNGFNDADVVFIYSDWQTMPGSEKGKVLGYVTAEPAKVTKSGTAYTEIQIWTVDGEKTVTVKGTTPLSTVAKGDVITLEPTTEEYYSNSNLKNVTTEALKNVQDVYGYGAITERNNTRVSFNGSSYDYADDAVILTVDTKAVEGTNDGVIPAAKTTGTPAASYSTVERFNVTSGSTTSEYYANAFYVLDTDGDVLYLVVDTNDKAWHGSKSPDTKAAEDAVTLSGTPVSTATVATGTSDVIKYSGIKKAVDANGNSLDISNLELVITGTGKVVIDEDVTLKKLTTTSATTLEVNDNVTLTVSTLKVNSATDIGTLTLKEGGKVVFTGGNTYIGGAGDTALLSVVGEATSVAALTDLADSVTINGVLSVTDDVDGSSSLALTIGTSGSIMITSGKTFKAFSVTYDGTKYSLANTNIAALTSILNTAFTGTPIVNSTATTATFSVGGTDMTVTKDTSVV